MQNLLEKFRETRFRIILVLGIVLALFLAIIIAGQVKTEKELPKILLVQPTIGATGVSVGQILSIKFDRVVEIDNLLFKVNPETVFVSDLAENGTSLFLRANKGLSYATKYFVSVLNKDGNKVIAQLSFTTIEPQGSSEPLEEEARQKQQYPLAPFNPPDKAHFYFQYIGPLSIKAYAVGGLERAKTEFIDWVNGLDVDISKHKIEWVGK